MTPKNEEEAGELAHRAGRQARNAGKNASRAAKAAVEPVVEAVEDEVRDTADKLEGTAQDAARAARKINPKMLSRISGDTGVGFLALSVAIYAGAIAYSKFRQVASGGDITYHRIDDVEVRA